MQTMKRMLKLPSFLWKDITRVMQAGKLNFERGQKRSKMTYLGLKIKFK